MAGSVVKISPFYFIHVLDYTDNTTRVEVGPKSLVLQTQERLVEGPCPMVVVPPVHYVLVENPVRAVVDGQATELRHGHLEVRLHQEPFPLYPGEALLSDGSADKRAAVPMGKWEKAYHPMPVVKANHAIRLTARVDFNDNGIKRLAGDIWQLPGPLLYTPAAEVEILKIISPIVVKYNDALRMVAAQDFTDVNGRNRYTGEHWLVRGPCSYTPGAFERVLEILTAITLTDVTAVHLRALESLTDDLGRKRLAGDEWLVTSKDAESYIPDVGTELVGVTHRTVLTRHQYCFILNPVNSATGRNQMGSIQLRVGPASFFLLPGEEIEGGIQNSEILSEDEALVLTAKEKFVDKTSGDITRSPGDRWMITGPNEYIPPVEVSILEKRKAIPLDTNEGVYVRDNLSGEVRAIMGPCSYMLTAHEVLFDKELPEIVETLLKTGGGTGSEDIRKIAYFDQCINPEYVKGRCKHKVVTYRCPGSAAVQVYNYKQKTARVLFGPDLVILGPHENFNVLSLSGGKPKKADALQSLCLMLGPDYITDIIEVETSDHAKLAITMAMNNHFEVLRGDPKSEAKIFSVPDFIGFACKHVGSRIRGVVAKTPFDTFHRNSIKIIHSAVFGSDSNGQLNKQVKFEVNGLVITNVDVQAIEPVDQKMRDSLQKSVQMAIEISTKSVEAAAEHEARRAEQVARGQLERQRLLNEKEAEKERGRLLELRAEAAAVASTGQARAEAHAHAEQRVIEAQSEVQVSKLKAKANEIEHASKLTATENARMGELTFRASCQELEVDRERAMATLEVSKVKDMVTAIGQDTLVSLAQAGPETQANLLLSLGIESVLITNGSSPVNLFDTARGLVAK